MFSYCGQHSHTQAYSRQVVRHNIHTYRKHLSTSSALFIAIYGIMLCVCHRWSIGYERFSGKALFARFYSEALLQNESLVMILIRTYSSENFMYDIFKMCTTPRLIAIVYNRCERLCEVKCS